MSSLKYEFGLILGFLLISANFASAQSQSSPINCYFCDGDECSSSLGRLNVCQAGDVSKSQTCVTIFGIDPDSSVISKGCSQDLSQTQSAYCESNPDRCITCSSDGCNLATDLSEFIQCLSCDSKTDKNCVLNPSAVTTTKLCYNSCMVALYATDATSANPIYELTRSCLDDKNLDGRKLCSDGGDQNCIACSGENCNVARLPEVRFNCYQCAENEDCSDAVSEECVSFTEDDQCYFLFDDLTDVVEMGCRSDLDPEVIKQRIKEKKLVLCDGADCNSFENFPQPNQCKKCSSDSELGCAINPLDVESVVSCGIPYSQCYSKVSNVTDGVTIRGCLSDLLDEEFYQCLFNGNSNCQSCSGLGCNSVIVPENRIKCQRCSSDDDSSCHKTPTALSVCPLYSEKDTCVSAYSKGVTIRGCGSEFTCDPQNPKSCQICSSEGCNTENVRKTSEESYGIFQSLPINCYHCSGEECEQPKGLLKKCEGSLYQDCLSVFNSEGKVISRGCENIVEQEYSSYCEANPDLCFNCKSNGCNVMTSSTDFVECIYCDTANDPDCVRDVSSIVPKRKCTKGCVTALYPRNNASYVLELIRTCVDDIESDDVDNCGQEANCVKCIGPKCNSIAMPQYRLSCNTCTVENCDSPAPKECSAYSDVDKCFMLFDETLSVARMGCISELTEAEVRKSIKQLFICDGDNCNAYENLPEANICAVCNSTSNVLCATNPASVTTLARCQAFPYTQCYSRVDEDGSTARGCLLSLEVDEFLDCLRGNGTECKPCVGSSCNKEIFPENRQSCYRCSSSSDADCESLPSGSQVCPLYVEGDTCVTKVVDGVTNRGCGHELTCGDLGWKNCRVCSKAGCNSVDLIGESIGDPGLWQSLPLNCYTCEGDECSTSMGLLKVCEGNKLQTCTSVFGQDGKIIARGCSDLVTASHGAYCDENSSDCIECKSNGCNLAATKSDYVDCLFCDGQINSNCTLNTADISRTRKCYKSCMTALYPKTSDADASYALTRTCLDDKDLDDREECESDPLCQSCSGASCNVQLIPEVRKACYHCSGESCQLPTTKTCNSYTMQEQCYILFDEDVNIIEMGCKSDYNPVDIRTMLLAKRLFLCDEDNCNSFDGLPATRSCHLCNSRTDKFCATDPQNVAASTSCNQLPITDCYTRVLSDGHTERGCLSSLNGEQFLDCYLKNSTECQTCDDRLCNAEIFPADRLACHKCNSAEDAACDGSPQHSAVCLKYSSEQTCVTSLDDDITYRGCSDNVTCNPLDSTICRTCNTSSCNVINLKRNSDANPGLWQSLPLNCYTCSGDECATKHTRLNVCSGNMHQHCVTVFGTNGSVVRRGCSDDVEEEYATFCDENSEKCFNCNSNGCNTATSLDDYIDCIYCDSRANPKCVLDATAVSRTRRCNKACMVALFPRSVNESSTYELSRTCLDDKDLDDRELCGSDKSLCKSCNSTALCNEEDAVDDRLECYSCQGESCENPVSEKCLVYKESDRCFMLFDGENSVQRMGCVSELDDKELEDSLDSLFTCSGNKCNDYLNAPQPQSCAVCDSKADVRCATSPRGVPTTSRCAKLPHVDCYSRVKSDGTTLRGCVSDLTKAMRLSCLSGNDTTCSTCKGDGCNKEVFPADRLQCHKCNSIDDPTCQNAPNASYVCPIYSADEICSSKLVNDVTYRGCGDDFICNDNDKQRCKLCNTTNCNKANLYENKIGYPGKWQSLPINCLTCLRNECNDSSTTLLRKCENNNLQNCVTVFNMMGRVVQRGCSDSVYNEFFDRHCDNHPELCTFCKSSGCNNANSLDDYVDCVFCDSTTNPNCTSKVTDVSRTRKCQKKCMTALYPRSGDSNPAYELSRSCLDDKDLDDREKCESGNEEYCKLCEGDSCNTDRLPESRLSCLRCSGESCEDPVEAECPAYRDKDRCLILFDDQNEVVQMGCASDFDSSSLAALRKKTLLCDGDYCNTWDIIPAAHRCLVCDSANDTLCATRPNSLTAFAQCTNLPYTSCYMRIEDGLTKRGCLSDVEMETIDECIENGDNVNCNVCASDNCNIEVYPENRRSCHRCSSKDDSNCQSNPSDPGICPLYQENDECIVEISGDITNRGCISEFTCNAEDRATCRVCSNDNCNSVDLMSNYVGKPGLWQDLPLSCYECEGTSCQSTGTLSTCSGNNLQNCMTVFSNDGIAVKRGCTDDVMETHEEYCDTNSGKCQSCKSSGCNNAASLDDYVDCIFCDSATNPNCVLKPEGEIRTRKCQKECMAALYPKTLEDDPSYELSRSCLDDKNADDRQLCISGNEENCQACTGPSCNKFALPNERHQCWTCRGEDCENAKTQDCVSYHPNDQCYILFDKASTVVAMGCRSEYEQAGIASLVQTKSLLLCDGKNCNSFDSIPNPQQCVVCNSAIDPRCATNPNLIINATTCSSLPYTGCFTKINSDGDTVRGCQSDLPNEQFYGCHIESDSVCSTCAGGRCNSDVYPANRLKCHRCNSAEDPKCAESPASNGICPKFTDNESCVASYKDGLTFRGCSSELSCDVSNKKLCRVCSGSACNVQNLEHVAKDGEPGKWQDLPINCYTCLGEACSTPEGLILQMCTNNNVQNCMTVFNAEGVVIQRGCSDPVSEAQETWCEANLDKCYRCNSNGCNRAFSLDDYVECLSCDTSTDASCVKNQTAVTTTRKCYKSCMTALYPRSTEDDPAYDTTRTCLDDKDLDDRDTCQEGSEELCAACDGGKCNDATIPANRRSCLQCTGDGCQLPKAELCSGYRSDDQCFIMFDEQATIVELGCKSDLTISQSIELVKAKRLFLCDGDDCNDFDSLPTSQACALCNSRTDLNCAVDPTAIFSLTTCNHLPYTQCYSRVLSNGATERGCLSSLVGNDFYDCLIGNSTSCTACEGYGCNKKVFPSDRIECYICDSSTSPNCETNPNSLSLSYCPKYAEPETCVTSFSSGTTYRSCGTSLECDTSNRRNCRVCSSAGCNIVDLASKQDDNFGKWQDLPLTCYQCVGEACKSGLGEAETCENNNEQDCSMVFNEQGEVIRRGCSDQIDIEFGEYCDENAGNCLSCKSNNCNEATTLSEFSDCLYCDSNKDPNCVSNPQLSTLKRRKCQGGCMVALYPSDSSSNPAYDMMRTCLSDKEKADQTNCTTGKEPFCKSCSGVSCNIDNVPENRLTCYSCLGDSCEDPVSALCPLYKEGDQCFVRFDNMNSVTEMGCLSAFRDQEVIDILKTKKVYICQGADCNSLEKLPATQKCAICNSASDVNCAINPHLVGNVGTCSILPYTDCYSQITGAGLTQRGCLTDLPADDFAQCILSGGDKCSHCVGDGCNREIFPESRLRCYTCSSDTDPDCESIPTRTGVCPYVRDSERCVSALGGNRTERGCSSQLLCDANDKSTCRHCSKTGCNTLDLKNTFDDGNHGKWQDLPLRCHNCSGAPCLSSLGPAISCTGGDQQDCMTVFDAKGAVTRRGCQYDVEDEHDLYCRNNPEKCLVCKSNECNDAWELTDFVDCIYCNSEIDPTCATIPTKTDFPTRKCQKGCMAAVFTASNGTTQVIRTCLDDKELPTQYQCATDESGKDCSSCPGESCNNFNYPRDRLTCHVCQGANCATTMPTEYCAAYVDGDSCFAKYELLKVDLAGCTSAVATDDIQDWREKNKLYTCSGDRCNALEKLPKSESCLLCDSNKDVNCATNPKSISSFQVCNAPINSCYSQIANGATQRGCLESLSYNNQTQCQSGSGLCEACDGTKCNADIYPSDRRRCHICTSKTDENCIAEPKELLICPNYMANDMCVVRFFDGVTERGCTSELTCDTADADHCRICVTDGCNLDKLDNAAHSLIANNLLLTLLVATVSLIGVNISWF